MMFKSSLAVGCLLGVAAALPYYDTPTDDHSYIAPGPNDSRSPCPGLNTLANHGYLPRNGRNITAADINNGFLDGFGMEPSTTTIAMSNGFAVCYYVTGSVCNALPNLTLLAEPHTLEHDASFSREDYHMAYSGPYRFNNNQNFNKTIFDSGLKVLGNNKHMTYSLANQVRLQRLSLAWQADLKGWFIADPLVQLTELGFIFGVMSDPTLPDFATKPQVRVDWWNYWTTNESFPTPLGWSKPSPPRNGSFVNSVAAAIQAASVTATPMPQPPATATDRNVILGTTSFTPVLPVPTDAPYVAPDAKYLHRRDPEAAALAGPSFPNPYTDELSPDEWAQVVSARRDLVNARMAALNP